MAITSRNSVAAEQEDVSNRLDEFVSRLRESFRDHPTLWARFDRHDYLDSVDYVIRQAHRGPFVSCHAIVQMDDNGRLAELVRDAREHVAREKLAWEWSQFISKNEDLVRTIADERRRAKVA